MTTRYALRDGMALTLEEFLDVADQAAITTTELEATDIVSDDVEADLLYEAPPCLQCISRSGCSEYRNQFLFDWIVYCKKRFPDSYEDKIDEYNQRFVHPPLGHKEIAHLIKSCGKKDYNYKCKDAPINAVCDRETCLTREYGVGHGTAESNQRGSLAVLLGIFEEAAGDLWHTNDQRAFVSVTIRGHREHFPVDSTAFRRFLTHGFYSTKGKVLASEALQSAIRLFDAQAIQEGPVYPVAVRVASVDGAVYIDLGNSEREIVYIHSAGWEIVNDAPVRFHRPPTMRALPRPVHGGTLDTLRTFVTIRDENDWRLLVGFLVGCLRALGPYPQLHLSGVQGSAKTTLARMMLAIIDPSAAGVRAAPKDERDLVIAARQTHLLAFDNVSNLSQDMSDALCRLSTGGGLGTRKLYTNDEEQVFEVMRPVVLNGIAEIGARPDLRDRAFVLDLLPLDDRERKDEATLWTEFESALPGILGALYDAVSCALREWEGTVLAGAPRMADVARWVSAAESALGWPPGSFLSLYGAHRNQGARRAVEQDALASAVMELVEEDDYRLSPLQLLRALNNVVESMGLDVTRKSYWPQTPRMLASQLKRIQPDLEKLGIRIERGRGEERWISISVEGRTGVPRTSYEDRI